MEPAGWGVGKGGVAPGRKTVGPGGDGSVSWGGQILARVEV